MKNRNWRLPFFCLAVSWLCAFDLSARPRPPLPPLPELAPALWRASFDEAYSYRMTNAQLSVAGYGELIESWSGYALQRSGRSVVPFIVPALDSKGRTNIACDAGAIRFWFKSYWSSASLPGGKSPGTEARLLEFAVVGDKQTAVVWSLQVSADGSALQVVGASDTEPSVLLQAEIGWRAGEWHLVTLDYGPKGTALFIDGELAAQGAGTVSVPPSVGALVVGSTLRGTEVAEGEFEELTAFAHPLTQLEIAFYRASTSGQAALGAITPEEDQAQREASAKRRAERDAEGEGDGSQMMRMLGGTSQCLSNVPVFITNVVAAFDTNQGWTVTFDLQGGTNGLLYDVFTTTNLSGDSITNSQWTWLEQGPTCSTYQYTNQPAMNAFYVAGTPLDSDGDGLTDAFENLVSKTSPSLADTDGDGLPDGWEHGHGLNPLVDDSAQSGSRANYAYDAAGRLRQVSGSRGKSIAVDPEGNVTQVTP